MTINHTSQISQHFYRLMNEVKRRSNSTNPRWEEFMPELEALDTNDLQEFIQIYKFSCTSNFAAAQNLKSPVSKILELLEQTTCPLILEEYFRTPHPMWLNLFYKIGEPSLPYLKEILWSPSTKKHESRIIVILFDIGIPATKEIAHLLGHEYENMLDIVTRLIRKKDLRLYGLQQIYPTVSAEFVEEIVLSIFKELIIEESQPELFNANIIAKVLAEAKERSPNLRVLEQLVELSLTSDETGVSERAEEIGILFNRAEYLFHIRKQANNHPDRVNEILFHIGEAPFYAGSTANQTISTIPFVSPTRIESLQESQNNNFDLSKLIRMCEEVNHCFNMECYYATSMLLRAIVDHIPPIFGQQDFANVIAQHGSRSTKRSLEFLQLGLRNIANAHLHEHIQSREILPNATQVNYSPQLDVLLGEVLRKLSEN